jgi:hypothetical protein
MRLFIAKFKKRFLRQSGTEHKTTIVTHNRDNVYKIEERLYSTHRKKWFSFFSSPAGMSLTKLSMARNNLIIPGQGEFE